MFFACCSLCFLGVLSFLVCTVGISKISATKITFVSKLSRWNQNFECSARVRKFAKCCSRRCCPWRWSCSAERSGEFTACGRQNLAAGKAKGKGSCHNVCDHCTPTSTPPGLPLLNSFPVQHNAFFLVLCRFGTTWNFVTRSGVMVVHCVIVIVCNATNIKGQRRKLQVQNSLERMMRPRRIHKVGCFCLCTRHSHHRNKKATETCGSRLQNRQLNLTQGNLFLFCGILFLPINHTVTFSQIFHKLVEPNGEGSLTLWRCGLVSRCLLFSIRFVSGRIVHCSEWSESLNQPAIICSENSFRYMYQVSWIAVKVALVEAGALSSW